ncbi:MAG: protoporphyrinogen oxidase [Aquificota bacterium]|nr:protoporphyrinogen oxidase [Aquificota bacterium]
MEEVVVVGSGVSGLSTAYRLKKQGVNVVVYEKEDDIGGNIKTLKVDSYTIELGPQTVLADEEVLGFFRDLGLRPVEASPSSKRRYILKKGKLIPVPLNPVSFLTSPLLSLRGKIRVFKEIFLSPVSGEESLADFVRRRLGEEVLTYLVQPFVSGVYAGDPEALSVRYAFPRLYALEKEFGSLIKGAVKKRSFGPKGKLVSFEGGLRTLTERLAGEVEVRRENVVLRIRRKEDRFILDTRGGKVEAKAVVVSSPAYTASYLLKDLSWSASSEFDSIDYPPVAVVNVGVKAGSVPDGFGFLVPRVENRKILGAIFTSRIFKGRAPEDRDLLTVYLGGSTDRSVADMSEEEIAEAVEKDLTEILGVPGVEVIKVKVWKKAIPQYTVGYGKYINLAREMEETFPGLFLTGNYLSGISVPDCIRYSEKVADKVVRYLEGC